MTGIVDVLKGIKPLAAGSKIPNNKLKEGNPEQADVDLSAIPGKTVILGVPGAFTPPCSSQVPGYLEHADQFVQKGVSGIYVVAVNDAFTTQAWKEKLGGTGNSHVHFLADDTAAFTTAAGQLFSAEALLGNKRSSRYAAIVNNGVVEKIFVEDEAPSVTVTKADNVLQQL